MWRVTRKFSWISVKSSIFWNKWRKQRWLRVKCHWGRSVRRTGREKKRQKKKDNARTETHYRSTEFTPEKTHPGFLLIKSGDVPWNKHKTPRPAHPLVGWRCLPNEKYKPPSVIFFSVIEGEPRETFHKYIDSDFRIGTTQYHLIYTIETDFPPETIAWGWSFASYQGSIPFSTKSRRCTTSLGRAGIYINFIPYRYLTFWTKKLSVERTNGRMLTTILSSTRMLDEKRELTSCYMHTLASSGSYFANSTGHYQNASTSIRNEKQSRGFIPPILDLNILHFQGFSTISISNSNL